jgi:hypothetical protein
MVVFPDGVRVGNIVRGLPVPDGSAAGVYASHVLEHLSYEDFWRALDNTRKMLKPGGIFRLIVPDLAARARRYVSDLDAGKSNANDWFMENCNLGMKSWSLRQTLGNISHLWMWDEPSMRSALLKAGFDKIRRCSFNDCEDLAFLRVESADRFYDPKWNIEECAMEARLPQ